MTSFALSTTTPPTTATPDQSAAIHDFDCIYSHDVQRKRQKRWHDGFLRFHAFNRRVMVYDIPRNFIGDTHLRDAETLQDGDELQLDRGILVEVGESRGTSRQDVTPLFEKKRATVQDTQPERSFALPPPHRSSPPVSSALLKPKPLNVVLGPRRGVQGRASLAKQSPYERANVTVTAASQPQLQRPAKRARLEAPHEPLPAPRRNTEQQSTITKASSLLPGNRVDRLISIDEQTHSSEQNAPQRISKPPAVREHTKTPKISDVAPVQTVRPDLSPDNDREQLQGHGKDRVTSKLKVSTTKRSKLMYLGGSLSTSKSDAAPTHAEAASVQKRRAPLRVSAFEPSSSPTSGNVTIMDFPTSQDAFSEQTPVRPAIRSARTLAELDQELLGSPPAPKTTAIKERVREVPDGRGEKPPGRKEGPISLPPPPPAPNLTPAVPTPMPAPKQASPHTHPQQPPPPISKLNNGPSSRPPAAPEPAPEPPAAAAVGAAATGAAATSKLTGPSIPSAPARPAAVQKRSAAPCPLPPTSKETTTPAPPAVSVSTGPTTEPEIGPWSRTAFDLFGFVAASALASEQAREQESRARKKKATGIRGSLRGMMREYCD